MPLFNTGDPGTHEQQLKLATGEDRHVPVFHSDNRESFISGDDGPMFTESFNTGGRD